MPAKESSSYPSYTETEPLRDNATESGYVSGSSSDDTPPEIALTRSHLRFLNRQLQFLEAQGQQGPSPLTLPLLLAPGA
jgi:phosphoadenosine phosphosulfate reductase